MKTKKFSVILSILFFSLIFAGCGNLSSFSTATIKLNCPGNNTRSAKDIISKISDYRVTITSLEESPVLVSDEATEVSKTAAAGSVLTIGSINPGNYSISVDALDPSGYVIASQTQEAELKAGQIKSLKFILKIIDSIIEFKDGALGSRSNPIKNFNSLRQIASEISTVAIPTKIYIDDTDSSAFNPNSDYEPITIKGNVIIEYNAQPTGNQQVTLNQPTVTGTVCPSIFILENNSTLSLNGVYIDNYLTQENTDVYSGSFPIEVKENATLILNDNCKISAIRSYGKVIMNENSVIETKLCLVKNAELNCQSVSDFNQLLCYDDSTVTISDSMIQIIECSNNTTATITDSSTASLQCKDNSSVTLDITQQPESADLTFFASLSDKSKLTLKEYALADITITSAEAQLIIDSSAALSNNDDNPDERFGSALELVYSSELEDVAPVTNNSSVYDATCFFRQISLNDNITQETIFKYLDNNCKLKDCISTYSSISDAVAESASEEYTKDKPYYIYVSPRGVDPDFNFSDNYNLTGHLAIKSYSPEGSIPPITPNNKPMFTIAYNSTLALENISVRDPEGSLTSCLFYLFGSDSPSNPYSPTNAKLYAKNVYFSNMTFEQSETDNSSIYGSVIYGYNGSEISLENVNFSTIESKSSKVFAPVATQSEIYINNISFTEDCKIYNADGEETDTTDINIRYDSCLYFKGSLEIGKILATNNPNGYSTLNPGIYCTGNTQLMDNEKPIKLAYSYPSEKIKEKTPCIISEKKEYLPDYSFLIYDTPDSYYIDSDTNICLIYNPDDYGSYTQGISVIFLSDSDTNEITLSKYLSSTGYQNFTLKSSHDYLPEGSDYYSQTTNNTTLKIPAEFTSSSFFNANQESITITLDGSDSPITITGDKHIPLFTKYSNWFSLTFKNVTVEDWTSNIIKKNYETTLEDTILTTTTTGETPPAAFDSDSKGTLILKGKSYVSRITGDETTIELDSTFELPEDYADEKIVFEISEDKIKEKITANTQIVKNESSVVLLELFELTVEGYGINEEGYFCEK